jgi:hypothetical protein
VIITEGTTCPKDAPPGLLRNKRDEALLKLVRISTGHSEVEERWLKANGYRSWINYYDGEGRDSPYRHVTDYWVPFMHDDGLLGPVLELDLSYGWWPEWGGPPPGEDAGAPARPGPAPAVGAYDDLLVEGGGPPDADGPEG